MPTSYYMSYTDSDLSGGLDFNKKLLTSTEATNSISPSIDQASTEDSYGYTEPNVPSTGGTTGDYSVKINVTTGDTDIYCSIAVARVNSSGVQQSISSFTSEQQCTAGVKTFNLSSVNLGTWNSGDRLRVVYRLRNAKAHGSQAITMQTGDANTEVSAPWSAGADLYKQVASTETISEAVGRRMDQNRQVASTVGISETADRALALAREAASTEAITEAIGHALARAHSVNEAEAISEEINRALTMARQSASTVGIAEAADRALKINRAISSTLAIGESVSHVLGLLIQFASTVAITEEIGKVLGIAKQVSDTEAIAEQVGYWKQLLHEASSTVQINEFVGRVLTLAREVASNVAVQENVGFARKMNRAIDSTAALQEQVGRALAIARQASSTVSIAEEIGYYKAGTGVLLKSIDETIQVSEFVGRAAQFYRDMPATVQISEDVHGALVRFRAADDQLAVTEEIGYRKVTQLVAAVDETIGIADEAIESGDSEDPCGQECDQSIACLLDLKPVAGTPPRPSCNVDARLYVIDVGGKKQIRAKFRSGADGLVLEEP